MIISIIQIVILGVIFFGFVAAIILIALALLKKTPARPTARIDGKPEQDT